MPGRIDRVIITGSPDAKGDGIVERVLLDLHWLQGSYQTIVERFAQTLSLGGLDPVKVHLENIVCFVRSSAFPLQGGPCSLKLGEDQTVASLEFATVKFGMLEFISGSVI